MKTEIIYPIISFQNQPVGLEINASIQKGFFQVDRKWTCYRRNYFTVACSMNIKNLPVDGQLYVQRSCQQLELVTKFAVSISAKTASANNQESEVRGLVQHTPKRNKESETIPGRKIIQPQVNSTIPSAGGLGIHAYGSTQHMMPTAGSPFDMYGLGSSTMPSTSQIFERIQFQKATANNGKRRAQQQYFHIVVELSADISRSGPERWVVVAKRQSDPMVVRGRSPGHYKDGSRRDSTASMDPDHGTGGSGDSNGGNVSMGSMIGGHAQASAMDWAPAHRNAHHYGGSSYRHAGEYDCSPGSVSYSSCFVQTPPDSESDDKDTPNATISPALGGNDAIRDQQRTSAGTDGFTTSPKYQWPLTRRPSDSEAQEVRSSTSSQQRLCGGLQGMLKGSALHTHSQAVCVS